MENALREAFLLKSCCFKIQYRGVLLQQIQQLSIEQSLKKKKRAFFKVAQSVYKSTVRENSVRQTF